MKTRSTGPAVVVILILAAAVPAARAGDQKSQFTFSDNRLSVSPACPSRDLPTFESLVPIPAIIDPFAQDFVPFFCQIQTRRNDRAASGVKGKYESELIVRDNNTGELESFPVGSGRFKTNSSGFDSFDFDIPSELFADGFESGDVSAWSYTRSDFTKKKKVDDVRQVCGPSSSSP